MTAGGIKLFFVLTCVSLVVSLDLERLASDCLTSQTTFGARDFECTTSKGLKIFKTQQPSQTFYCINYEKKIGKRDEFDVLSFDLSEDYDLKFTGANVITSDAKNPMFKLYDLRSKPTYMGRFAFGSDNPNFKINNILINDEAQICYKNSKQVWPLTSQQAESSGVEEITTRRMPTTTFRPTATPSTQINQSDRLPPRESCGTVRLIENIENYLSLPSIPGKLPWLVSIYRYFNDNEESYYKCAGTIINRNTVLTSVNCLLEDGLLLKPSDLRVIVATFALSTKMSKNKIYRIANLVPHEAYNYHLDNNIAAVKLAKEIEFNNFVQPICLPDPSYSVKGKIGKLAGFGKSTATQPRKTDLLTDAEYAIRDSSGPTFEAENTSGNGRISDIGGGLYINETNHWTLAGIMSRKASTDPTSFNQIFTFTNVAAYLNWIDYHMN